MEGARSGRLDLHDAPLSILARYEVGVSERACGPGDPPAFVFEDAPDLALPSVPKVGDGLQNLDEDDNQNHDRQHVEQSHEYVR
jgi:hypothetical protein